MTQFGLPALHGLLIWWLSTCLIMFLDGLPRRTFRWSMTGATFVLLAAVYGLAISRNDTSVAGAYIAFTSGVMVWAWLEISFYMGFITGPRTHRCAAACHGWRHFGHAIQASLYHEIAVLLGAALVVKLIWGGANPYGMWTFITLWWMHQSARLNVFLGVPNLNEEFLPDHLEHIKSFMNRKPMNLLFPFSVTISTVAAVILALNSFADRANDFRVTGDVLLTTMMFLAILEHWFLVVPFSALRVWNGMWQWSLGWRDPRAGMKRPLHCAVPTEATIGGGP
jgi:putative photosynthetic complex assembly protein 2